MKKIALFLVVVLALSLFSCGDGGEVSTEVSKPEVSRGEVSDTSSAEVSKPEKVGVTQKDTVVFLGDSIAAGYGLATLSDRYSDLLQKDIGFTMHNYAVSGDDGRDLIDLLNAGTAAELKNASVVVLSIGANNILSAGRTLLETAAKDLMSGKVPENVDVTSVLADINSGLVQFKSQLALIVEKIREASPDCRIVFQTVYNPYSSFASVAMMQNGVSVSMSDFSDSCVQRLNGIISGYADYYGYEVCDVYTAFNASEVNLINADLKVMNFDPHPNAEGHKVLAEILKEVLQ